MIKNSFVCFFCILKEYWHFLFRITFSYVGDVDAAGSVGCLLQGLVRRWFFALVVNQNIAWCNLVSERGHNLTTVVAQVECHINSVFRHRYEEYILETLGVAG